MMSFAIIFDVDGVLLELTREEEELFFEPFASRLNGALLSRDWNSYKIRNDEEIVGEIVKRYGLPAHETVTIAQEYLILLEEALRNGLRSKPIAEARKLLQSLEKR